MPVPGVERVDVQGQGAAKQAEGESVAQRTVIVASRIGLHARPAAVFTKAAMAAGLPVRIRKENGDPVLASSIVSVLALGVNCGDEVTIEADGDHADAVLDDLATLISRDLDAEPA